MKKGFTLVELLIVIGVLGTLVVVSLSLIDPLEKLARARDAGRMSAIEQLGKGMNLYMSDQNSDIYPTPPADQKWQTAFLKNRNIVSNIMEVPATSPLCGSAWPPGNYGQEGNVCYYTDLGGWKGKAIIWTYLEAKMNYTAAGCVGGQVATAEWLGPENVVKLACATK